MNKKIKLMLLSLMATGLLFSCDNSNSDEKSAVERLSDKTAEEISKPYRQSMDQARNVQKMLQEKRDESYEQVKKEYESK